jgi:hypothetical protein
MEVSERVTADEIIEEAEEIRKQTVVFISLSIPVLLK